MAVPGGSARRLAYFLSRPSRSTLCAPWPWPETGVHLRSIPNTGRDSGARGSTWWSALLARSVLADDEYRRWSTMWAAPTRRVEWLLGRVAMKDAVRSWAMTRHGVALAPKMVRIETTSAGAPFVRCDALDERGGSPAVSLAHCRSLVLAAVGDPGRGLGVDVESEDRNVSVLSRALTPEESAMLEGPYAVLDLLVAKEAAAKARGTGLGGSLARWPVVGLDPARPGLVVASPEPDAARVRVVLARRGGVVASLAQCDVDHL